MNRRRADLREGARRLHDASVEDTTMALEQTTMTASQLADRWWVPLIRGIAAILFGIFTLAFPTISLLVLIMLWGAYALVDGVLSLVMAFRRGRSGGNWGWLMFEGIVGVATGIVAFAWPGMTALVLLMVIAAWAILTGIAEIATAIRLRKEIKGEWLLAASGILSIVFGGLLLAYPGAGALAMLWVISGYAIFFGVMLLGLAWRLNSWRRKDSPEHRAAAGTMPRQSSVMP
jgi:uncharacterized membrane protein HdeD (DUF308 family)